MAPLLVEQRFSSSSPSHSSDFSSDPPNQLLYNGSHQETYPNGTRATPIAICGMALRLPGGVMNTSQFWDLLASKRDARSRVPETRYKVSGHYTGSDRPGEVPCEFGYFLDESVDLGALDTSFYNMTRTETERLDPQQRQLLEVAREALENAGEVGYQGKTIGCYVGSFGEDWCESFAKDPQIYGQYRISGYEDLFQSNRISYEYDLKGPSMTIRTGCSSSLVALHETCLAISRGDCESAIIGGANLILGPGLTTTINDQSVLSPDASCKSFDADANGYARAEAINAVYIKSLQDAIRDGNPIRAVIRGTHVNCDGKTAGMSIPNAKAHEVLIRNAYSIAGISDFSKTAYVECHGTGTAAGDPLEASAVAEVFGDTLVYIGSVKPNVGHSEGASGLTSLIKTVLALEHRTIPPNIKFNKPNPRIPFGSKLLKVPTELTPWPETADERASVNSFGIGGVNAHVVLESATNFLRPPNAGLPSMSEPRLLVHSANTSDSLVRQIQDHHDYLLHHLDSLHDLSYTLAVRREHLPHRAFTVTGSSIESKTSPSVKVPVSTSNIVMVFTGQGAQWPQMGRELLESNTTFRKSIALMDKHLGTLPDGPQWLISDELCKTADNSNLQKASYAQPICTALQIGLIDALAGLNVFPKCVVGHSSGEIAAAYAAGRLTARQAIITAYYRGVVSGEVTRSGSMAAVGLGWHETSPFLIDGVVIACENSPSSVTVSGDADRVGVVLASIKESHPEVLAKLLQVDRAYHSLHMKEIGEVYHTLIHRHVIGSTANLSIDFFSSVTGKKLESSEPLDARYWQSNLESPVLFSTAVTNLVNDYGSTRNNDKKSNKSLVFLEVGPHSALAGPLRQIFAQNSATYPYSSCIVRGQDSTTSFLSALGEMFLQNISIDFRALTDPEGNAKVLTDLPTYPWQHDRSLFFESRLSKEWRFRKFPKHELLGLKVLESTATEPSWRNMLLLDHVPWIRDHNIKGDTILPCAAYIAMAGEAVRQLKDTNVGGISLRNIVISTAMVISNDSPTEIMTSLKKHMLTDNLESVWWEFSISSHNGSAWTRHCVGQVCVRSLEETSNSCAPSGPLPRKVSSKGWYEMFRSVGANYGPLFRGLTEISASTTACQAVAKASVTIDETSTYYYLHPTQIDVLFQLVGVAAVKGIGRAFKQMAVPTYVESIDLYRTFSDIDLTTSAETSSNGVIYGEGYGFRNDGQLAVRLKGLKLSHLEDEVSFENKDLHAGARTTWKPDIDFLDAAPLIKPHEGRAKDIVPVVELTMLCAEEIISRLPNSQSPVPHMQKYRRWLESLPTSGSSASYRNKRMKELFAIISSTPAAPMAEASMAVVKNIVEIYEGRRDPLEVLMDDNILMRLYDFTQGFDRSGFFQAICHSNPKLRILEIGAGTGATTSTVLRDLLNTDKNQYMYSQYTYTDISAGFFGAAKEKFKDWPNLEFLTLDISKDPLSQGFELESYDLIIATDVLHATPSLQESLKNVRKILNKDGRLLLQEMALEYRCLNVYISVLPGWWLGEADGRPDEPFVSPERWEVELKEAGFQGLDTVVLDAEDHLQFDACMIARPTQTPLKNRIAILCDDKSKTLAHDIEKSFTANGFSVIICQLQDSIPADHDVLALLDIETPFFTNMQESQFESFKTFVSCIKSQGILWATRTSQLVCTDPRFGQTIGTARVIRTDFSIDFATCEIDHLEGCQENLEKVFRKFLHRHDDDVLQTDFEYAIVDGVIHVPRIFPFSITEELQASNVAVTPNSRVALEIEKRGRLNTMKWARIPCPQVEPNEVLIETHAFGMNFRDVLSAMGIVPTAEARFGHEAAGIVLDVGTDVQHVRIGDRVFVQGIECFASPLLISGQCCVKIPDTLSFEDAATMPCVYATVIYSLIDIARLEKGQTVLIHSACGGVGIAAIQICRMIGAEVYATVGNEEKVQFLLDHHDIPRDHIFNSRDASFREDVMRMTEGCGVDVVLNSLSGELLHASWDCVAEFGSLLEIGKRDFIGNGRLAMKPFELNRRYCGFDLGHLLFRKPATLHRLLKNIVEFYNQGHIKPIHPVKVFPASAIEECFRYMQKGQHIGKIVFSMSPNTENTLQVSRLSQAISFDSNASYLLVGGLGGLGKAISTWMVEHGARQLVYLSRSAGKGKEDRVFIQELKSQGCIGIGISGDVSNEADVKRAIQAAEKPLRGVMQMSMVLRDNHLSQMTFEDWNTTVAPKVQGTWNLHNLTIDKNLDFFVMFSSGCGVIGQPGQANYASGSTFLDAFAQYRESLGLAASTIDIGVMEDIGYVAENTTNIESSQLAGYFTIREPQLVDAVALAASIQPTLSKNVSSREYVYRNHFLLGFGATETLSDPNNHTTLKRDRRIAAYHSRGNAQSNAVESSTSNKLRDFLLSCSITPEILKDDASNTFLARQIAIKVQDLLLQPLEDEDEDEIDVSQSLQDLGLDSLVAIETKSWWKTTFGFDISVLEMLGMGTVQALGEHAANGLLQKYDVKPQEVDNRRDVEHIATHAP